MSDVKTLLQAAIDLAALAAPTARAAWLGEGTLDYKADGSALTQADLDIEALWRGEIAKRFPGHGILGEEYGAAPAGGAFTWVLDPIDGTRQFGAGLLNFASLISVCREGVPIVGVIDLPHLGARFAAAEGLGAHFNGRAARCSGVEDLRLAKAALANPDSFEGEDIAGYQRLRERARLRVYDGGSPAYGALARGKLDLCLNGGDLDAYDICALRPVVAEAGGVITDWRGEALGLWSTGAILASATRTLHDAALDLLSQGVDAG